MNKKQSVVTAKKIRSSKGFTLLEFILVIMLLGFIAASGSEILVSAYQAAYTSRDLGELDWQGRIGLARMAKEVRLIRSNRAADLNLTASDDFAFTDVDNNLVRFFQSGSQVLRQENGGTARALVTKVNAFSVQFLDVNLLPTLVEADTRYVSVSLTLEENGIQRTHRQTYWPGNFAE